MDSTLLHLFNQTLAHPALDAILLLLTRIAQEFYLVLGVGLLLSKKHRRFGIAILLAYLVTLVVTLGFQFAFLRPRPINVRLIYPQPNFPSYPSGHASCAFAFGIVIALHLKRGWGWLMGLGWATSVAFSRVYLGMHYPSDVIAGAVLGVGSGIAVYGVFIRNEWRWLLAAQIALIVFATFTAYLGLLPLWLLRWHYADKVLHALLFGAVAFWLNLWLRDKRTLGNVPLAIVLPFAIAAIEECLQSLSPVRTFDLFDLACDLIGLILFWWLSQRVIYAAKLVPIKTRIQP